jgi:SPX domain protein involved in polyphosphate accumulation
MRSFSHSVGSGNGSAQPSLTRSLTVTGATAVSSEQREKDFLEALDSELAKIIRFYLKKEAEVSAKLQELTVQIQHAEGIQAEQGTRELCWGLT